MNKIVVVTGANGGIGLGLVQDLSRRGFFVIAQHRGESKELLDLIPEDRRFKCELTDERQVHLFYEKVTERFGTPWGLINVAGSSTNALSWKMSIEEFKKVVDDNLLTTFMVCREFVGDMRQLERGGRIINTSSVVAFSGVRGASHYCAAKAGVVGFSKALALELASKQITVNTLALGYFNVGLIDDVKPEILEKIKENVPLKRLGVVAEVGAAASYLLGDDASFVTGQVLHLNGGLL